MNTMQYEIPSPLPAKSSRSVWLDDKSSSPIQLETSEARGYVVSILVNPQVEAVAGGGAPTVLRVSSEEASAKSGDVGRTSGSRVSISLGGSCGGQTSNNMVRPGQYFYFPEAPSGLSSPSESTTDSGTGSDFDGSTPPPLPKRKQQLSSPSVDSGVSSVTTHSSIAGSDEDEEDSISCDSLNSSELNGDSMVNPPSPPELIDTIVPISKPFILEEQTKRLQIQDRPTVIKECSYAERQSCPAPSGPVPDHHYDFHLHENVDDLRPGEKQEDEVDSSFAGVRNVLVERSAIRSAKGTVRGVKNRVRAGIATFLQMDDSRSFKEREQGKLVVYTTTMGVVRATYMRCVKVKQILRTLLVKFEERDVFMSRDTQQEVRMRVKTGAVVVPQVFLDGHHLGDADTMERLNESGELRRLLRPFKCPGASVPCGACGGYRLLPCTVCNGSKKSVHRNHFTAEFVALKCMTCDESGLMRCHACS